MAATAVRSSQWRLLGGRSAGAGGYPRSFRCWSRCWRCRRWRAAFPGTDPFESPRINTPDDPDFDRCEGDDQEDGTQDCASYFEEEFRAFGFSPDTRQHGAAAAGHPALRHRDQVLPDGAGRVPPARPPGPRCQRQGRGRRRRSRGDPRGLPADRRDPRRQRLEVLDRRRRHDDRDPRHRDRLAERGAERQDRPQRGRAAAARGPAGLTRNALKVSDYARRLEGRGGGRRRPDRRRRRRGRRRPRRLRPDRDLQRRRRRRRAAKRLRRRHRRLGLLRRRQRPLRRLELLLGRAATGPGAPRGRGGDQQRQRRRRHVPRLPDHAAAGLGHLRRPDRQLRARPPSTRPTTAPRWSRARSAASPTPSSRATRSPTPTSRAWR